MNVAADASMVMVSGVSVDVIDRGRGRPLLFLHPGIGIERNAPVLDALAQSARVIAPSHPGFGRSELPKWMTTVDDLAYFYLDFLDALDLRDVALVGVSLGGCPCGARTTAPGRRPRGAPTAPPFRQRDSSRSSAPAISPISSSRRRSRAGSPHSPRGNIERRLRRHAGERHASVSVHRTAL